MCSLRVSYCPVLTLPVRRNEATRMRGRDVSDAGSVTRRQGAPDLRTLRPEHFGFPVACPNCQHHRPCTLGPLQRENKVSLEHGHCAPMTVDLEPRWPRRLRTGSVHCGRWTLGRRTHVPNIPPVSRRKRSREISSPGRRLI